MERQMLFQTIVSSIISNCISIVETQGVTIYSDRLRWECSSSEDEEEQKSSSIA